MPRIKVNLWLPVILCLFHRFDPFGMFIPFLLATAVHELGHMLCIGFTGGKVTALTLTIGGAAMETTPLSYGQEFFCALAGPAAGILLLVFRKSCPWLAFWGLTQSLYNLLPVYPLDGGRAFRALLLMLLPLSLAEKLSVALTALVTTAFCVGSWLYLFRFSVGMLAFLPSTLLLAQVLPYLGQKSEFPVANSTHKRYNNR